MSGDQRAPRDRGAPFHTPNQKPVEAISQQVQLPLVNKVHDNKVELLLS